MGELYDDITLQTRYRPMTDEMEARADKLADSMRAEEAEDATEVNQHVLQKTGESQSIQKNTSNDIDEMYEDIAKRDLVQLRDHENDSDDVVPEFSDAADEGLVHIEHHVVRPIDFAGAAYDEQYDE